MFAGSRHTGRKLRRRVKGTALVVALVLSAYLISMALRAPQLRWLGWFGFLPLFFAMRQPRPLLATLAGGLWGACVCVFYAAASRNTVTIVSLYVGSSTWLFVLMIVIPAVYLGLAAMHAPSIGCKLLTLTLGWVLIEAVLHLSKQSGTPNTLITGTESREVHVHWFVRLLGYLCTVLPVVVVNASLVGIFSEARLTIPPRRSLPSRPVIVGRLRPAQAVLSIQSCITRQAYPRAPPVAVSITSSKFKGRTPWPTSAEGARG